MTAAAAGGGVTPKREQPAHHTVKRHQRGLGCLADNTRGYGGTAMPNEALVRGPGGGGARSLVQEAHMASGAGDEANSDHSRRRRYIQAGCFFLISG